MKPKNFGHIGDGVYAQWDGYHLVLQANVPVTDQIFLDWGVMRTLATIVELIQTPESEEPNEVPE